MDVENQLLGPTPNVSASEQEKEPDCINLEMPNTDEEQELKHHPPNGNARGQEEELDCINLEMPNTDEEQELKYHLRNGNAQGQEEKQESRCLSLWYKYKMQIVIGILVIVICILLIVICILAVHLSRTMGNQNSQAVPTVSSNHQKDVIKSLPDICPFEWVGYQGHCYKFSTEEKNWMESQNDCISHNASLAKISKEEIDFVTKLIIKRVFWIGLNREPDQPWKWPDGENAMLKVMGNGADCAYLTAYGIANSGSSIEHHFICKKY